MDRGDFSFFRKISIEDVREILSELVGRRVTKVNYFEHSFSGSRTSTYKGSIEKEDDGTFSFKTDYGTYKHIDKEIADLQVYDGIGRPLKGKIHHVSIRGCFRNGK